MSDLAEFLLARIAEDEAAARRAIRWSEGASQWADAGQPDWEHIARWDPARVLAECEAKRRIVELHRSWDENDWQSPPYFSAPMDDVLAALALPYADHPDYREEWRS